MKGWSGKVKACASRYQGRRGTFQSSVGEMHRVRLAFGSEPVML
jgi:hypothetical protein